MDNIKDLILYIKSDMYRQNGADTFSKFVKFYIKDRAFRLVFWYRVARYYRGKNFVMAFVSRNILKWLNRKMCMDLTEMTEIGYGLKILHGYGLMIHSKAKIGNNVTFGHYITIANEKNGIPTIGDRVRVAPGAVILGNVYIGNGSVIGANCVVNKDVPDQDVAVGVPNRNLGRRFEDFTDRYYWDTNIR